MKKLLVRILSICLILCMGFTCVACKPLFGGNNNHNSANQGTTTSGGTGGGGESGNDDKDDDEDEEDDDDFAFNDDDWMATPMYGTKILYRPDSYDFSGSAGGTAGQEKIYYQEYAYVIMDRLYNLYAIPNTSSLDEKTHKGIYIENYLPDFLTNNKLSYLYDSMRYKVDTVGLVTTDKDGSSLEGDSYYIVSANTSAKWNWSFNYNTADSYMKTYINEALPENTNYVYKEFDDLSEVNPTSYYSSRESQYKQSIIIKEPATKPQGYSEQADYDNHSQMVKALTYVIYCYALDLEPNQITVESTTTTPSPYYTLKVTGFIGKDGKPENNADRALEYIQNVFEKSGSFVGLTSRQIHKIKLYIQNNIIGEKAMADDFITTYSNIQETDDGYDFSHATILSKNDLGRDYAKVVSNIVDGVCANVKIGTDEGKDLNVDGRFLASEIMEYAGDTFIIEDDKNFPKYTEGQSPFVIRPLEYQSIVPMFKERLYIDSIYLALKYDADNSGTDDEVFGDEYIEIQVDLNYYNHASNFYGTLSSQVVRVYDGYYDIDYMPFDGENGAGDGIAPADHSSGVEFAGIGEMWPDNPYGELLPVGEFNVNVGDGILMTDVGEAGYCEQVVQSQSPIQLIGSTDVKKWYSIVEPGADDPLCDDNHTYISGRLNPAMFQKDSKGCDYIEFTFKVLKKPGEIRKNYKFYAGIQIIDSYDKPYTDNGETDVDDDVDDFE